MSRRLLVTGLGVASVGVATTRSSVAIAETVEILPTKDNTIFSQDPNLCDGAGEHLFAAINGVPQERRSLLQFDVNAHIPPGSTINSASLRLYVNRAFYVNPTVLPPPALTVNVRRVLQEWGNLEVSDGGDAEGFGGACEPGEVSWANAVYGGGADWGIGGGNFSADISASVDVGPVGTFPLWSGPGMTADVQGWLDGTLTNAGWIIVPQTVTLGHARRFNSKDNLEVGRKPTLIVDFTPPAGSGACCIMGAPCEIVAGAAACTNLGGTFSGAGSSCDANACAAPTGACCIPDVNATCLDGAGFTQAMCEGEPGNGGFGGVYQGDYSVCSMDLCPVQPEKFVDPLPIPSVAMPDSDQSGCPDGKTCYTITVEQTPHETHSDLPPMTVWGMSTEGGEPTSPGPTFVATSGEPIQVRYVNDLRDEAGELLEVHPLPVDDCLMFGGEPADPVPDLVFHLHGGHVTGYNEVFGDVVDAGADGYPTVTLRPGESTVYDYPNLQPPGTLWYHDHTMGKTRLNVLMGLAGGYLITDAAEQALNLPSGEYEAPLVIQDRSFNIDGTWRYAAMWMEHILGDVAVVNGKVWPFMAVDRGKYRYRMVNGSGTRTYRLTLRYGANLENILPFQQIGSDLGLLSAPVTRSSVLFMPGERLDVIVDFESLPPGTNVQMINDAVSPYPAGGGTPLTDIMQFRVGADLGHTTPLPAAFTPVEVIPESESDRTRSLRLIREFNDPLDPNTCTEAKWSIDSGPLDGGTAWDVPIGGANGIPLGSTEIWSFRNNTGVAHPMHMHMVAFQVLDRRPLTLNVGALINAGPATPPDPWDAGWKDTVRVEPFEQVRVIARFEDFVGLYPVHCHILEHEDNEMMRQFSVTTTCGDGLVGEPLEDCEPTVDGQDQAECDGDCTLPICGDNRVNAAADEECDPGDMGDTFGCDSDCTLVTCGDGHVNPVVGEACDGGDAEGDNPPNTADETEDCNANCSLRSCGDNIVNEAAGEECETQLDNDGDPIDIQTCDADCTEVKCGDDHINEAALEECDDGNDKSGDGCSETCQNEGGAGGQGGGGNSAGGSGPGTGGGGGEPIGGAPEFQLDGGGCSCEVGADQDRSSAGLFFGLGALITFGRRRRRVGAN